jgi:PAS domain S-box-containing protein
MKEKKSLIVESGLIVAERMRIMLEDVSEREGESTRGLPAGDIETNEQKDKAEASEWCADGTVFPVEVRPCPRYRRGSIAGGAVALDGIAVPEQADDELRRQIHDLSRRVKELDCLCGISSLAEKKKTTEQDILKGIVELIPPAWQYPDITCARIVFENMEIRTENYQDTQWKQVSDIYLYGNRAGSVEVGYLEERPHSHDGPFLRDEGVLINAIAEKAGRIIERFTMEEELRKSHLDLQVSIEEGSAELTKFVEQAYGELVYRQVEIEALLESARAALHHREFADSARIIFDKCKHVIGAAGGYVALISSEEPENELLYLDSSQLGRHFGPSFPMHVPGPQASACGSNKGVFHNDLKNGEYMEFMMEGNGGIDNVLFSPLIIREKTVGMLCFFNKPGGFRETDIKVTSAFGDIAVIACNNSRTLTELRESEKRYKTFVESVTDYIYTVKVDNGVAVDVKHGPGCIAVTGYDPVEFGNDPCLWYRIIFEEDRSAALLQAESIISGANIQPLEHRIVHKSGRTRWVKNTVVRRCDDGGRLIAYDGLITDITELKTAEEALLRTNKALKTLSRCNERLVRSHCETDLLQDICEIIVSEGGYRLAWVGFAEQDEGKTVRPVKQFGFESGYLDEVKISWSDTELGRGPEGECIRSGKPSVINDVLNDPRFTPWKEEAVKRGYMSIIGLPLRNEGGTFGCLVISASEAGAFDEGEIRLLVELADDLAFGIVSLRIRKAKHLAEEKISDQVRRLQKLAEISVAMSGEPADVFNMIVASMAELLNVPVACLAEVRGDELHFLSVGSRGAVTSDVHCCSLNVTPWALTKEEKKVQVCHDVIEKFPEAGFLSLHNAYSYCGFQVPDGDGRVVAVTCLLDDKHHEFSEEDKYLFQIFGQRIAVEIERHRNLAHRRRIEKSLKESENRYRTLFERANDAIFIVSAEGEDAGMIVDANRAAADMHGYTVDELMSMCITDLCSTESAEKSPGLLQKCLHGELVKTELDHRKKDGEIFPVELSAGLLELQGYKFILAFDRDITERKKSEDERDRLISKLQDALIRVSRAKKEWQDTFDSITDHISIIGEDFTIIRANKSFAEGYGLDPRDVAGNKCYKTVHYCDSPGQDCPHWLTMHEMKPVTREVFDPKTKGIFRISTYPYRSHEGELLGSIHIARDITIEKKREIQLRRSERLASLGQLSAGMAHEIKNPIHFIMGNARLLGQIWEDVLKILRRRYDEEGDFNIGGLSFSKNQRKITDLFAGIEEGSRRIMNIVATLKVFTAAKTIDHEGPVDINGVIGACLMFLESQIKSYTDKFIVDVEDNLPALKGNGHNLEQVMSNLIMNALQSLPAKTCGVTLSVWFDKDDNGIVVKVLDEGVGMAPEVVEKVCEPFFTTKRENGGIGLGLSICRSIIEDHGGSLCFESKLNEGTTATVMLPLMPPSKEKM